MSSSDLGELADGFLNESTGQIKYFKLISALLGAFVAFFVGAWVEFMSVVIGLQVWAIDGVGNFLARLLRELLGAPAAAQVAAWEEGFRATLEFGPAQPFILAVEALVLFAAFQAVRDRGVVP